MEKKKILHIAEASGGVEAYLKLLISNFGDNYEHVLVLSSETYDVGKFENFCNVSKVYYIYMDHNLSWKDFKSIKNVRKIIKDELPDVLYCHSTKAGFIGRLANKRRYYNKVVYNAHGWCFNMKCSKPKQVLYKILEKKLSRKTDKIVCISQNEKQSAINYKICKQNKLELIYNGIDYDGILSTDFSLSRNDFGYSNENIVVGQVGRLCEQKGTSFFLDVAKELCLINENYRFILVGDGPLRNDVEKFIIKNGLEDKFLITGWVNNPLEYANLFDVACLFSQWEGFGFAIEEYKALNKNIIALSTDAISELLDNTVDEKSVEEVVNRIINQNFCEYKEKFDIKDCVQKHLDLLASILDV